MSTEQDKDAFALKRNRGGDGGLDVLGGPGLLLGSPDKKKRKPNSQVLTFAPLSEYAPPLNPSTDHLVASNPFDDGFPAPSYKTSSITNPYFGPSHYPGFCGHSAHRMPPQIENRLPVPYGGVQNQIHPFGQGQMNMTFNRSPGFNYGHPDNSGYGSQAMFGNNHMPLPQGQPFRSGPGENFNQTSLNVNQNTPLEPGPTFGSDGKNSGNSTTKASTDMSPSLAQRHQQQSQQSNLLQSSSPMSKQEMGDPLGKSPSQPSPHKHQRQEENLGQENAPNLKAKARASATSPNEVHPNSSEKINGIIHPSDGLKKSPASGSALDTSSSEEKRKRKSGGLGPAGANKLGSHPRRPSLSSTDPVYPCGICLNEVNDDQEAILCDASCQKWFHRVCTGMTETAYNLLAAETAAVWGCDSCMEEKGALLIRARESSGPGTIKNEG